MSVAQFITQSWFKKAKWLVVLTPFSALYGAISQLNQFLYIKGFKKTYVAPVPVIVVGNITVGGSGKTPFTIALAQYLSRQYIKVGIISRGYGGAGPFPQLVTASSVAAQVGDEPLLMALKAQVPVAVAPNRQQSIELLLSQYPNIKVIISDDGLQHHALGRNKEFIVVDTHRGLGNGWLLPAGPLRESCSKLKNSLVINHVQHIHEQDAVMQMQLQPSTPYALQAIITDKFADDPTVYSPFSKQLTYHAVTGIGYPQRFYQTLTQMGMQFVPHSFNDHHAYTLADLNFADDLPIITTEKDAVKILPLMAQLKRAVWVVPVEAELNPLTYDMFEQTIAQLQLKRKI